VVLAWAPSVLIVQTRQDGVPFKKVSTECLSWTFKAWSMNLSALSHMLADMPALASRLKFSDIMKYISLVQCFQ
jgi:hypothetical protein